MLIKYQINHNKVAVVTLNRPEAANALSADLLDDLQKVITKIHQNPQINCMIIIGANDRVFCAGADLKERIDMDDNDVIQMVAKIGDTISMIERLPMPTIAALNGAAFGGGLELALACDLRMIAEHASVGLTETSLAIIPGAGGTQRLTRLVGLGQAKRLIYTAEKIDAKEALHIGLVEEIVASDELLHRAIHVAEKIASNGPIAIRQAKRAIDLGFQTDLTTGLAIESACYEQTIYTEDRLEGLRAFSEKRQPKYKGK